MRIIYGGAFNPPTIAHQDIYRFVESQVKFTKFIYLPVSSKYNKADLASNEDRFNMLKILTKDMKKVEVSRDEFNDEKYLGTYHYLVSQGKDTKFLMGSDNLRDLHNWINYDKLVRECQFIVVSRSNLDDESFIESVPLLKENRQNFLLLKGFDENISSHDFRLTHNKKLLTKEVYNYIKLHGLYGGLDE